MNGKEALNIRSWLNWGMCHILNGAFAHVGKGKLSEVKKGLQQKGSGTILETKRDRSKGGHSVKRGNCRI